MSSKTEFLTYAVGDLNTDKILEFVNDFLGENKGINEMQYFDDYCATHYLSFTDVVDSTSYGNFSTSDDYFRYDGSEFISGDDIDDVYDYLDDEDFAAWIVENLEISDLNIRMDDMIDYFCSNYEYDKDKLINHPNWDEENLWEDDWDDILDILDIEEDDVKVEDED